jgi:tRNA (guanine-N7-)-methyltransferase
VAPEVLDGRLAARINESERAENLTSGRERRARVSSSHDLKNPTEYVDALHGELAQWALDESRALQAKGTWRTHFRNQAESQPLDVEIGPGNGYFLEHRAAQEPTRNLLGIELKFKPLIQSIRRCLAAQQTNVRVARMDASLPGLLFGEGEIDDVFIFFPDPWPRPRSWKHRLISSQFLDELWRCQRAGSRVFFKTDSKHYFEWSLELAERSKYRLGFAADELSTPPCVELGFESHFEKLFRSKGLLTKALILHRDEQASGAGSPAFTSRTSRP